MLCGSGSLPVQHWSPVSGSEIPVLDHGFVRLDDSMADDLSVVNSARVSFATRGEFTRRLGTESPELKATFRRSETVHTEGVLMQNIDYLSVTQVSSAS
jgi:hypothetical protein